VLKSDTNATVEIREGSTLLGTATADGLGNWTFAVPTLADGTHQFSVTAIDAAGNVSVPVNTNSFTVDTAIPTTAVSLVSGIDNVPQNVGTFTNGASVNDTKPAFNGTLSGPLASGEYIEVKVTDGLGAVTTYRSDTNASLFTFTGSNFVLDLNGQAALGNGAISVMAAVFDGAGNASASSSLTYTQSTTPAVTTAPTLDLVAASDTGVSNTDNITSNATPTVTGTVGAGTASVTIFADVNNDGVFNAGDTVLASNVAVSGGTFTAGLNPLADGGYKLMAVGVDAAGNTGPAGSLDGTAGTLLTVTHSDPAAATKISGDSAFDYLGYQVANIGDFNGDGIEDIAIGAHFHDDLSNIFNLKVDNGAVYIVYGTETGIPQFNDINAMTAAEGVKILGAATADYIGEVFNEAGDVNGDGFNDIIIGNPFDDSAYVVFGGAGVAGTVQLADIAGGNNTNGYRITVSGLAQYAGYSVAGAGDVNNDGYDDLLVGAPLADPTSNGLARVDAGAAYVIYGHAGGFANYQINTTFGNIGTVAPGQATTITAQYTGGIPNTSNESNNWLLGENVHGVGDVSGDGIADYIVSAPQSHNNLAFGASGTSYLIYGTQGGIPTNVNLNTITPTQGTRLQFELLSYGGGSALIDNGNYITGLGDINGDGIGDFAIAAPINDLGDSGKVYVVYGQDGGFAGDINLDATMNYPGLGYAPTFSAADGFVLTNERYGSLTEGFAEWFGSSVRAGGDINGDGIDDFIVGARYADDGLLTVDNGAAYVVYGRAGGFGLNQVSINDVIADPSLGYVIRGDNSFDHNGMSVASGDWNGDGISDVATGAWLDDVNLLSLDNGAVYAIPGTTANLTNGFTSGADTIVGTSGVDRVTGGLGNDQISNIGLDNTGNTLNTVQHDMAYGGGGNDIITLVGTNFTRIDGGLGTDKLVLAGSGLSLNLPDEGLAVQGIEQFDLGNGGNTLTLRLADVIQMPDTVGAPGHMVISGGATDTVDLVEANWSNTGTTTVMNGQTYDLWSNASLSGTKDDVWIQQGVAVV
jgi:hypothetical protein